MLPILLRQRLGHLRLDYGLVKVIQLQILKKHDLRHLKLFGLGNTFQWPYFCLQCHLNIFVRWVLLVGASINRAESFWLAFFFSSYIMRIGSSRRWLPLLIVLWIISSRCLGLPIDEMYIVGIHVILMLFKQILCLFAWYHLLQLY